jgi:hypothetical protein
MFHRHYHNAWLSVAAVCLVTLGFVLYPASNAFGQDAGSGGPPRNTIETAVDDADIDWEEESTPRKEKSGAVVIGPEDVKEARQFEHSLYLPGLHNEGQAGAASVDAAWRRIFEDTFETSFPSGLWAASDYNGSQVGGFNYWKRAGGGYNSTWAVTPTGGYTYPDFMDTWMRYGPFSLAGALDARFSFAYWLSSEQFYDYFSWEYSCKGAANWKGQSRSGMINQWVGPIVSLKECIGYTNVYIRFTFKSDYSNPTPAPAGVWVDRVRIEVLK